MLAASRLANTVRVAMPYAQWVAYLVQLGYLGYKSYQMYQDYRVQLETDARNGCNRTLDETIELVIKPRRKRNQGIVERTNSSSSATNTTENQENEQQRNLDIISENITNQTSTVTIEEEIDEDKNLDTRDKGSSSTTADVQILAACSSTREPEPSCDDDEVTIVYDSFQRKQPKTDDTYQQPQSDDPSATSSNPEEPLQASCDTESETSTSIESTDSNKGIINDVYTECFICARSLDDPRKPVATLPFCMHPFHQTCLDGVLKWHPKCPVCDFHIFSPI